MAARMPGDRRGACGFSLVELAVALVVILILAGAGGALWFAGASSRGALDGACLRLLAGLGEAQQLASAEAAECWIEIAAGIGEADTHGYRIYSSSETKPRHAIPLPEQTRFASADLGRCLRFDALGAPLPSSTFRQLGAAPRAYFVELISWDGAGSRRITVQPATGWAAVEEP
jgi:prepilin-type N-terminal cleavage/methylation domain-containing protein